MTVMEPTYGGTCHIYTCICIEFRSYDIELQSAALEKCDSIYLHIPSSMHHDLVHREKSMLPHGIARE